MPLLNNKCLKVHPEFYSGHRVITCILNHPKSPPSEVTVTYRSILDRDAAGSPERARLLHLAPSVSQSLRAIWFILPSHGATIKDKSVETVEQNKRFLSASFRNFKNRLSVDSLTPLSPFSMLKYASLTLSRGYNIEMGRAGRNVKIEDWKPHTFNETGLFRGVSQLLLSMIVPI